MPTTPATFEITTQGENRYRWILWGPQNAPSSQNRMNAISTHSYPTKEQAIGAAMKTRELMTAKKDPEIKTKRTGESFWILSHESPIAISSQNYKRQHGAKKAYETTSKNAENAIIAEYNQHEK